MNCSEQIDLRKSCLQEMNIVDYYIIKLYH